MRKARVAAVVATALGLLGVGGVGTASAQVLPLEATVRLSAAPTTGEVVSGVRTIKGYAEAPEGVTRVDLYVVEHSVTSSTKNAVPVASTKPTVPLGRHDFRFTWDSAKGAQGIVDIIVVATTPTRTAEARVVSLEVRNVVKQATPATPKKAAPARAKATTSAPTKVAAAPSVARRTSRVAARVAGPAVPRVATGRTAAVEKAQADQAAAFYTALSGDLAETAAASLRPSALTSAARTGRGAAPSIAVALVLLLAAAHVQRAVRVQLAP
jgi:hypothetical protein